MPLKQDDPNTERRFTAKKNYEAHFDQVLSQKQFHPKTFMFTELMKAGWPLKWKDGMAIINCIRDSEVTDLIFEGELRMNTDIAANQIDFYLITPQSPLKH